MRCMKHTAYEVDEPELQLYAKQLWADLEQGKNAELVSVWDDECGGSTTEEDDSDVEQDSTAIESGDQREEGASNSSSMCAQDESHRGDWGERGGTGDQEDDVDLDADDEESKEDE